MEEPTHVFESLESCMATLYKGEPFKPITYQARSTKPDHNIESAVAVWRNNSINVSETGFSIDIITPNHVREPNRITGFRLYYAKASHFDEKYLPKLLLITFAHVFIRHAIWNKKAFSCIKVYAKCFWFSLRHPWVIQKN